MSTQLIGEPATEKESLFYALIEMIEDFMETDEAMSLFRDRVAQFDEYDLLALAAGSDDIMSGERYHLNLAALCALHNQVSLLEILAEKTPALIWQRFIDDEEVMPMMTPLHAAIFCHNSHLFIQLLRSPSLIEHSQGRPLEYAALIDSCEAWCKKWTTSEETTIRDHLSQVASSTLFTEAAKEILTKTAEHLYRHALPLQPYHGAPDCVKHIDFEITVDAGDMLRNGASVNSIGRMILLNSEEMILFMKNPFDYPRNKLEELKEQIDEVFLQRNDVLNLRPTHFSAKIVSTPDAEQTMVYLRFSRLGAISGASCA